MLNIGRKGSQFSPDYECFILHNIRGQSSFSLSFDGHLGLSHWDGRVPRTQRDKFSLKPNGSTWQTGDTVIRDGDVFVIQKGAWRKHVLGIIPIRRSGFSDPDERPESGAFQEVKNEAKRPIRSFPSLSLAFSHTLIKSPILKHRNMKL